jgi:hypothetical protein
MRNTSRFIGSLILAAALIAPVAIMAAPVPQDGGVQIRIYDRSHKDYHNWDDHENRAWGIFLTDNHRKSHEYSRASKKEQGQYWNWRHQHHDRD